MNAQSKDCVIMLVNLLGANAANSTLPSNQSFIEKTKSELKKQLEICEEVRIDVANIKSISPSFAYELFAQLYTNAEQLEGLKTKIKFLNDTLNLSHIIWKAIDRRKKVLLATSA